jgi:hypothetical protein
MHAVQTDLQYVFIHIALLTFFEKRHVLDAADLADLSESYKQLLIQRRPSVPVKK